MDSALARPDAHPARDGAAAAVRPLPGRQHRALGPHLAADHRRAWWSAWIRRSGDPGHGRAPRRRMRGRRAVLHPDPAGAAGGAAAAVRARRRRSPPGSPSWAAATGRSPTTSPSTSSCPSSPGIETSADMVLASIPGALGADLVVHRLVRLRLRHGLRRAGARAEPAPGGGPGAGGGEPEPDAPLPDQSALPVQHPERALLADPAEGLRPRRADGAVAVQLPARLAGKGARRQDHPGRGAGGPAPVPGHRAGAVRRPPAAGRSHRRRTCGTRWSRA